MRARSALRRAPLLAALASLAAASVAAQDHPHRAPGERLGTVRFATSCRADVAPRFDRAVALLHSFEFGQAIRAFSQVLDADPSCAMAHWGIALSRWGNPSSVTARPPAVLARGREAAAAAARVAAAAGATERERAYVAAVATLFDVAAHPAHQARVNAYERAMANVAARFPADTEARIFHAVALVGAAPPTDKSYASQRRAGAILEPLWIEQPDHPGLAHYIIHSYDVPALAAQAVRAAERYAEIAPAAAHALHMPSHTFTRLGRWDASVRTNERSMAAAARDSAMSEVLHAADYLVYANLQMRRDGAARAIVDALPGIAARFDPTAITGAAPGWAGLFALAAIPARHALERGAWADAASLAPRATAYPYTEAMTYFARALGAARAGRPDAARVDADSLAAIRRRLDASGEAYWAEQVAIQELGARAWIDLAADRRDDALARMREAATREDATEKSAVTPGPLAPARELLGDMLLALGRPAEALAEFRATLTREPNRYRALHGAMTAARGAGNAAAVADYERALRALTAR